MTIVGHDSQNHPLYGRDPVDEVDDRMTPVDLFDALDRRFRFTLDAAASPDNAKCATYYTRADNGLAQSWAGHAVWCNPPFSVIRPWVEKAWTEHAGARGVVLLLPANRTEQPWWQQLVEPYRDRAGSPLTVEFIAGRPRFLTPQQQAAAMRGNRRTAPPFGCCLLIWNRPAAVVEQLGLHLGTVVE